MKTRTPHLLSERYKHIFLNISANGEITRQWSALIRDDIFNKLQIINSLFPLLILI